jgi:hypothetical protein
MSRLGRASVTVGGAVGLLALAASPSYADGLQQCMNQAADHNGEPPICTKVNGTWVASWPDSAGPGGVPGIFIALFVIGGMIGLAMLAWKVTTARKLARQSGMDPGLATQMTLLTENGLDATYLASSLRPQGGPTVSPPVAPAAPPRDVAGRLAELKSLVDQGLVTQTEYDARRQAIIDSV